MTSATKGSGLKWVGRAMRRLEDPALVQGRGRFTADLAAAYAVRFVRSPVASGRIVAIAAPTGRADRHRRRSCRRAADRADAAQIQLPADRAADPGAERGPLRRRTPRCRVRADERRGRGHRRCGHGRDRGTPGRGRCARGVKTRRAAGARQLRRQCRGRRRFCHARFRCRDGAGRAAHRRHAPLQPPERDAARNTRRARGL